MLERVPRRNSRQSRLDRQHRQSRHRQLHHQRSQLSPGAAVTDTTELSDPLYEEVLMKGKERYVKTRRRSDILTGLRVHRQHELNRIEQCDQLVLRAAGNPSHELQLATFKEQSAAIITVIDEAIEAFMNSEDAAIDRLDGVAMRWKVKLKVLN